MVPSRLVNARHARSLTQSQLAQRAKIADGGTVSRWERGETAPSGDSLTKLADALRVSLDWLSGKGDDAVPAIAEPEKGAAA